MAKTTGEQTPKPYDKMIAADLPMKKGDEIEFGSYEDAYRFLSRNGDNVEAGCRLSIPFDNTSLVRCTK